LIEVNLNLSSFLSEWYWVDASDIGQQPGHFAWSDGRKVNDTFSNFWVSGNPGDFGAGKEACVYLVADSGKFGDYQCKSKDKAFICEMAAKHLFCP